MSESQGMYFEDLRMGQIFVSGSHTIDRAHMLAFAQQFDPQHFHLDEGPNLLGSLAASGWYTAALTQKLMVGGGLPLAKGMIGLSVQMRWPKATRPGDVIRVESHVREVRASRTKPDRGIATIYSETLNDRNLVLQEQTATIMVDRKP